MNAHHPWWNSKRDMDSKGDLLATLIEGGNFYLVNEPEAPTFFQYRQATSTLYESVLDLAFATGDLFEWISNWAVCDRDTEATGSDHHMLRFEILHDGTATVPSPTAPRYNWKAADWELFDRTLKAQANQHNRRWQLLLATQHRSTSLDSAAELLRDIMVSSVEASVPRVRIHARSKAWWTIELTAKRKAMKVSQRQLKQSPSPERFAEYKSRRNEYYRSIRKSKTEMWNKYVEDLEGSEIYKVLKRARTRHTQQTPTIIHNGYTATSFQDKAQLFRSAMFPPPPVFSSPPPISKTTIPWVDITDNEIRDAIFTSAPNKAAGPDGLSFRCLRTAYDCIPTWFHQLYKAVLSNGYYPRC